MPKHLPYTIKIELVRGCTMRCPFCALPEMEWVNDPWQFMSEEVYKRIIDDLAQWRPKVRIEFAERGEQTFHKNLIPYVQYLRDKLPKAQLTITSNGDTLQKFKNDLQKYKAWVMSLLDAGVNVMMLDCYTKERYAIFQELFSDSISLFYEDNFHPYRYIGPKTRVILLVDGTIGEDHIIRTWHNAAGSVNVAVAKAAGYNCADVTEPLKKMCIRPFREMEIHYDGKVLFC